MMRNPYAKGRPNKVLRLLADKYPTKEAAYEKLIYLQSRLSLPKGVEHFMSDLHGEYASFFHILNNIQATAELQRLLFLCLRIVSNFT